MSRGTSFPLPDSHRARRVGRCGHLPLTDNHHSPLVPPWHGWAPEPPVSAVPGGPVSLTVNPDGPDWTFQELLDHLRSRGLRPLKMRPFYRGQHYGLTDSDEEMYTTSLMLKEEYVSIRDYPKMFVCEKNGLRPNRKGGSRASREGNVRLGPVLLRGGRNDPREGSAGARGAVGSSGHRLVGTQCGGSPMRCRNC